MPRLQGRGLSARADADDDGVLCLRNIRVYCQRQRRNRAFVDFCAAKISAPEEGQSGRDRPPRGDTDYVSTREVPAENPRPSPKQSADGPQPSPAEEPRFQGRNLRERAGAGDDATSMPPSVEEPWQNVGE